VAHVVAMIGMGSRHLILHTIVLGAHRDGLRIHPVADVLHPPLGGRHGLVMVLLDLSRLAVASRLCDHLLDIFRADVRGIVADVDEVVLPVQSNIGDVWLLSQGPLNGTGAAQFVNATEFERAVARGGMVDISLRCGLWITTGHRGYSSRTLRSLCSYLMLCSA
jgi:hypothetical protein